MQDTMVLYSYFRSSASYRVRIALYVKNIPFEYRAVHLLKEGGQQFSSDYQKLNPQSQVPCLVHNGCPLSQSMAIIQYLDEWQRTPALLPIDSYEKALMIQFCEVINSGIQPLQNLMVLKALETKFNANQNQKNQWVVDWNHHYLTSIEKMLKKTAGEYCFGDQVTAADCFLIPQVFSTVRFQIDLTDYPTVERVYKNATALKSFQKAAPENQPDYEK